MANHSKPSRSGSPNPIPSDTPDEVQRRRDLPEGQIPGLPVSNDPLLQPMPRPAPREVPPLD